MGMLVYATTSDFSLSKIAENKQFAKSSFVAFCIVELIRIKEKMKYRNIHIIIYQEVNESSYFFTPQPNVKSLSRYFESNSSEN